MGFFDEALETFEIFSASHFLAILFWILVIAALVIFRKGLRNRPGLQRTLEITTALLMLGMQMGFYLWTFWLGEETWELLPFGVCHLSMYLTCLALLFQSEKIFRFIFPWAIMGSVLSLIIADLTYQVPHFRYFHYFFNHGMFLIANLYFVVVKRWRFTYRDMGISALTMFVMSIILYFINPMMGTNHMFMAHLPVPAQPLFYWLGEPWWRLLFILSVAVMFHMIYGFYRGMLRWTR
jgi:hypothetical integral membrane protein (TIGR02206 family)